MGRNFTEFEVLPGQSDRNARGIISFEWCLRQKALEEYSLTANLAARHKRAKLAHITHFRLHRKDKEAAYRLAVLVVAESDVTAECDDTARRFFDADAVYKAKMLDLAGIPLYVRRAAVVRIIDQSGSVEILPRRDDIVRGWAAPCILRADGTLERLHD